MNKARALGPVEEAIRTHTTKPLVADGAYCFHDSGFTTSAEVRDVENATMQYCTVALSTPWQTPSTNCV